MPYDIPDVLRAMLATSKHGFQERLFKLVATFLLKVVL
jgi:hypothetical protein